MKRDAFMDDEAAAQLAIEIEHEREDAEFELVAGLFVAVLVGTGIALW